MEKSIGKQFAKYVSLNVLGMLGISFYILADTFFISIALGSSGLAALNFTLSVFNIMFGLGQMTGIGGAARSSILKSLGKKSDAEQIFMNSLYLGMAIGIILMITGIFFSSQISQLLGADSETIAHTEVYLCTMLCFAPCFVMNYVMTAFVRNDGNPTICMAAMLVSSMANIVLDYVCIFLLSMGMYGAVFATGLSPIISLAVLCLHLKSKKNELRLVKCKVDFSRIISVVKLGISSFITEFSSAITVIAFNLILLKISGNTGVAAYGIVANTALVASSVFGGLSQGIQPLASRYCGKRDGASVGKIAKYSALTIIAVSLLIYSSVFFGAELITAVFNSERDAELGRLAVDGLRLYFLGYAFAGVNIVSAAFFSAVDMPKYASVISILRSAVLIIPAVILMGIFFGVSGVWLSFTVTEGITCAFAVGYTIKSRIIRGNLR